MKGKYDSAEHNPSDYIHPVIAALFLPKNSELEHHFLYSSISGIVKHRYNQEPLMTRPDYELFYDLVTDPNDIVCNSNSPMSDLLHRANLQNQLWNAVLHLRNGQYYNSSFREFMTAVDVCRLNKYDNPDLIYGRHDGIIIKRLLSAFSYRPTVVSTMPITVPFAQINNPYYQNLRPTVSRIPMITVKLWDHDGPTAGTKVSLEQLLKNQNQKFIEGNMIVERQTNVIYSRGVLIVYVDRRHNMIELNHWRPYNFKDLPVGISGFERINEKSLNMSDTMKVGNDDFVLLSAVVSKTKDVTISTGSTTTEPIVIGSWTYLHNATGTKHRVYNPMIVVEDPTKKNPIYEPTPSTPAVTAVTGTTTVTAVTGAPAVVGNDIEKVKTHGTVLIYQAKNLNDNLSQRTI
jgi:hypothetical protein